jgi:hypothetical protein
MSRAAALNFVAQLSNSRCVTPDRVPDVAIHAQESHLSGLSMRVAIITNLGSDPGCRGCVACHGLSLLRNEIVAKGDAQVVNSGPFINLFPSKEMKKMKKIKIFRRSEIHYKFCLFSMYFLHGKYIY